MLLKHESCRVQHASIWTPTDAPRMAAGRAGPPVSLTNGHTTQHSARSETKRVPASFSAFKRSRTLPRCAPRCDRLVGKMEGAQVES